jgi:hypothetical protein
VDLAEQRNALVSLGLAVDLLRGGVDLSFEVLEQREQAVYALAQFDVGNCLPALPNRSACWWMTPCLARIACTRFLIGERVATSVAR